MLTRIYAAVGSAVLIAYGVTAWSGWEPGTLGRETPAQAQSRYASGGHRSHYFWFFRGGK